MDRHNTHKLEARLTFHQDDTEAGPQLDRHCAVAGVKVKFLDLKPEESLAV